MRPPQRPKTEFEQVDTTDWILGVISDIQYNETYKRVWQGEEKIGPAVRLKFELEGYKFPHYSGWLSFGYSERSNLYKKYISSLVEGAIPDMDFDLDQLKGLPVKIMFKQNGEYQNVELIRPVNGKVKVLPF